MVDRLRLWDDNKDVAMLALAHLLEVCEGLEEEPVIVITDTKDAIAQKLKEAIALIIDTKDEVEAISVANQNGATLQIIPISMAQRITQVFNHEVGEALQEQAPEDQLWCAIVAGGGVSLLQVPLAPLRAIGSA